MGPSPNAAFLSDIHQIASSVDATVAVLSVLSSQFARLHIRHAPRRPLIGPATLKDSALPASVSANASRSPPPAASSLPLVQHDEMQPVDMSSRTPSAATSTLALSKWQAAEPLPRSLNIVKRSPCPTVRNLALQALSGSP